MNKCIKYLDVAIKVSIVYLCVLGSVGPIILPIYRKMQGLEEFSVSYWFIVPPVIVCIAGCYLLLKRHSVGYLVLVIGSAIAYWVSPSPNQMLVPLVVISMPFWVSIYLSGKAITKKTRTGTPQKGTTKKLI